MNIKGKYRDILTRNGKLIADFGWKSNEIVEDYGRFLAALMKKDFHDQVGLEFIVVGNFDDFTVFKEKVAGYFDWLNKDNSGPRWENKKWIWAKKIIAVNDIKYLDSEEKEVDPVTNRIKIDVIFERNEPYEATFDFKEFSLIGINKNPVDGRFLIDRMFFINYVNHGVITKDKNMKLSRTIKLTFPIEKEEDHE